MPTEGHNDTSETVKDAFSLSDEEYQKERERLLSIDSNDDKEDEAPPEVLEAAGNASDSTEKPSDNGETADKKEVKPFSLEDEKQETKQEDTSEKEVETFEIVHRGQVHKVTKDKMVELAQKGFDYDFKVGPHGKLVQLIDSDREAQEVLNSYIRNKYGGGNQPQQQKQPELKPLSEYEDERQWLADNVKAIQESMPKPQPVVQADPVSVLDQAIRAYDPVGCHDVIPRLAEFSQRLSIRDGQTIEEFASRGDLRPFFKFYEYAKEQVSSEKQATKKEPPAEQKSTFRMKSRGGEPPRSTEKQINAWELPQKDFQAMLAKVKAGYS